MNCVYMVIPAWFAFRHQTIFMDITKRMKAEEAARHAQRLLQGVFNSLHDAVFIIEADTANLLDCNPAATAIFGYTREEMIGQPAAILHLNQATLEAFRRRLYEAVETKGALFGFEYCMKRKSGSLFPSEHSVMPLTDDQGRRVGWISVVRDLTERKQAEAALKESQQWLRALIEHAPVALFALDCQGRIMFSQGERLLKNNKAVMPMVGQSALDLFGSLTVFEDNGRLTTGRALILRILNGETIGFAAQFQETWYQIAVSPLRNQFGLMIGAVGVALDITERKRAEHLLRELTHRLRQAQDEERRRLARELHDSTGQRLAAALMNLELLKRHLAGGDAQAGKLLADSLALVEQCSQEVRTLSYLLHPPLLDDLGLAESVRDYADGFAKRSGLRVDLEVSEDWRPLAKETELVLFRILQQSLANVHRHSDSLTASIRLAREDGAVRLEVSDSGRGMPPEVASGRDLARMGVGIAGMRERLQELEGRLEIESGPGGTTVRAWVPVSGAHASPESDLET